MSSNGRLLGLLRSAFTTCALFAASAMAQSPYENIPGISGSIYTAKYDTGGEGVAYHDSTPENEPGAYRPTEGVDVFETNYNNEIKPAVGWVTPGEWIEYTVNVPRSAYYYDLFLTFASDGPGGTMHVEFNGTDRTGPIEIPDTGGWEVWHTKLLKNRIYIAPGTYTMRLVFDKGNAEGWLANILKVEFWDEGDLQYSKRGNNLLPGKIEAENYDEYSGFHPDYVGSSEGVSYHDSTPENEGGAYRDDGVDIFASENASWGYAVGWVTPGEWLEYNVHVYGTGTHVVEIRYASLGDGGSMHLESNSRIISSSISLPDTGGWDSWRTITVALPYNISSGSLRLVFDSPGPDGWLANIDYLWVKLQPHSDVAYEEVYVGRLPGYIQAAAFNRGGEGIGYHDSSPRNGPHETDWTMRGHEDVDIEDTSDTGTEYRTGFDVGWITPGEWLAYKVYVEQSGLYTIRLRHASQGPGGKMHVELNGRDITGPITLPDTGGWQQWQTLVIPNVSIESSGSSPQKLRLVFDEGHDGWLANINWIGFIKQ